MGITIVADASATLRGIEALHAQINDGLRDYPLVELDGSAIAEADLSFIQLVEAARAHAAQLDRIFRLTEPANQPITALLHRAGMLARPGADFIEFWFHGELPQ